MIWVLGLAAVLVLVVAALAVIFGDWPGGAE